MIESLLDRVFGDGGAWDRMPLQRFLLLWLFPVVGLLFGGLIVALTLHQAGQGRSVGYVAAAPFNCVLDLSDHPGGVAEHRVEQYRRSYRIRVCEPPAVNTKVFYDPRTNEQVPGPRNDTYGLVVAVAVVLLFSSPGVLGWINTFQKRRARRRAHPAPTHS